MHKEFFIKIIICIIAIKFASAEVVDINNEQIIQLSNADIPIVDVRRSSEWAQTGVIPNSILLTFFDDEGNYDYNEWSKKLRSEIDDNQSIPFDNDETTNLYCLKLQIYILLGSKVTS